MNNLCRGVSVALGAVWLWLGASGANVVAQPAAIVDGYRIVRAYPHDPDAFTQGLLYLDGFLFESTGLYGRSTLRKVKLKTGEIVDQRRLDFPYFAEGLGAWNGQLVQLTWRSQIAFVYDRASLTPQPRRTFNYSGEGWGLTQDSTGFILSDGSEYLRFLDPNTFREIRRVTVTDQGVPVRNLNELELIRGEVYANVWHTDRIARIAPHSGRVTRWIDLGGLMSGYRLDAEAVLNGIAYNPRNNHLFVTGKLWPRLFEIEVVPRKQKN